MMSDLISRQEAIDLKARKVLENGIKDTMWSMFRKGGQKANLKALEDSVMRLIRMATQKNAGQRGDATCIDWDTLNMELMMTAIEAAAFVLDDRFNALKSEWDDGGDGE